jgi:hypothetical protein
MNIDDSTFLYQDKSAATFCRNDNTVFFASESETLQQILKTAATLNLEVFFVKLKLDNRISTILVQFSS